MTYGRVPFLKIFIVIQLQLYAFSPHPSTPPQPNPPPSPTSTLSLDFVHVSFIVVPESPGTHPRMWFTVLILEREDGRERNRGRESDIDREWDKERDRDRKTLRNIDWLPPINSLTGDWTHNLSHVWTMHQPTELPSQGRHNFLIIKSYWKMKFGIIYINIHKG